MLDAASQMAIKQRTTGNIVKRLGLGLEMGMGLGMGIEMGMGNGDGKVTLVPGDDSKISCPTYL